MRLPVRYKLNARPVIFGRPFVKRFALCYHTAVCLSACLSCLSVTLVYCGQMVGWIKTKLSMQLGLGHGHIVLDGNPASPPTKGHSPQFSAHICCGQTAGWIKMPLGMEVGLGQGDYVLDGDPAPSPKRGKAPNFRPMSTVAKRLDGARWHMEVGLGPGHIVLDRDPAPLPQKRWAQFPNFRPTCIVAKRLYVSGCHLVRK